MPNYRKIIRLKTLSTVCTVVMIAAAVGVFTSKSLSASTTLKERTGIISMGARPGSFSEIIDRVGVAVVSIRVTGKAAQTSEIPVPFKRFFGDNFGSQLGKPAQRRPRPAPSVQGIGSGFFIDDDGYVVTNNHVVGDAEKIEITLKDGTTHPAKIVGRDVKTDLALLKVDARRKFPFVRFGISSDAKVGDWVIALGSPFGLGHTATTGIVSARGRDIGAGPYDDFLQIDAPINRGNSGGPTFNIRGEVIGVNTAIISPTGVSAGIGFAVPSDMAKSVIAQLREKGAVSRGWLGVEIQQVTEDLAAGLRMTKPEGALISNVTKESPAERAGLKAGDVIVAVNDERIETMRELPRRVANLMNGKITNFRILRGGRERTIKVIIGKMPTARRIASANRWEAGKPKLGITLAAMSEKLRARYNVGQDVDGVIVIAVDPDSVASLTGIRPGDILRRIGDEESSVPADPYGLLDAAIAEAKKQHAKAILLLVNRMGNDLYFALPLRNI